MGKLYADIIIDISHEALDRVFSYKVPFSLREEIQIGQQVAVPFGRGNHERKGFVVGFSDKTDYEEDKVKEIIRIEPGGVTAESRMLNLAYWIREHYGSTMIQALRTVLPVQEKMNRKSSRWIELKIDPVHGPALLEEYFGRHYTAKARLLAALLDQNRISWDQASHQLKISKSTVDAMVREDVIRVVTEYYYRNPNQEMISRETPVPLNQEQQDLVDEFRQDLMREEHKVYLLHGVTGSGKTEVYLAAIEEVIKRGEQAIVLIPEIALTYQTVQRFTKRFGDRVSILNSRLSKGEKYDQWLRAKQGDVDVIIGPRSALFVPFPNLGLIVIDEEHESSYKSEQTPKYHARETAIQKASMEGASVILGSATPSVESYKKALEGRYCLWELTKRAQNAVLPRVYIEDLREELKAGNRSIFSRKLRQLMEDRLAKGEQIGRASCRERV